MPLSTAALRPHQPPLPCRPSSPAPVALLLSAQELREQLQRVGQQLERVEQRMDERLAFMEDRLGRRRSWPPLWNGGDSSGGGGGGNGGEGNGS